MASGNAVKSYHSTTTGTTAEIVGLKQFWDRIEITNKDDADYLTVRFDQVVPVSAAAETQVIPPGGAKVFGPSDGIQNVAGVPGSTTAATFCHHVGLVGTGAVAYSVEGIAGM